MCLGSGSMSQEQPLEDVETHEQREEPAREV